MGYSASCYFPDFALWVQSSRPVQTCLFELSIFEISYFYLLPIGSIMSELTLVSIVKLQVPELRSELYKLGLETKGTKADLLVRLLSAMNDIKLDKDLPDSAVDLASPLGVNAVILTNNETSEEHSQPLEADDDDDLHEVINVESLLIEEGKQMHGYSEIEGRLKAGLHEIEQKLF